MSENAVGVAMPEVLDLRTGDDVRREVVDLVDGSADVPVFLDLAATTFVDSIGVAVLLTARNTAVSVGTTLTLRNVSDPVRKVLDATGTLELFIIEGDAAAP